MKLDLRKIANARSQERQFWKSALSCQRRLTLTAALFSIVLGPNVRTCSHKSPWESWNIRQFLPIHQSGCIELISTSTSVSCASGLETAIAKLGVRPSIRSPLLRILVIGYLYGVSSERKLVEELHMHLAWRWFTGLDFDQEVPNYSTFSKNRHGRFQESKVFEQLFEKVMAQCRSVGLVRGDQLSVDGTFVEANASKESRIPREQLAEAAQVNRTVREYLAELENQNPIEEPTHNQDKVSSTDPDSTYATKGGTPARMGYYNNYLIDNHSCIVVGVQATGARLSEESRAAGT